MDAETIALNAIIERDHDHECAGVGAQKLCVRAVAVAELPSRFGTFRIMAFWNNRDAKEHVAVLRGNVVGAESVPTRLHSECLTGDVLGSLRCDCQDQCQEALRQLAKHEVGMLLYLRQEGRGIGLINKIRAYSLQDRGMDTVEANMALGFRDDERDYAIAAHMINSLGVRSIQLMTNNPSKMKQMQTYGVKVDGRIPHVIPPNSHNRFYLETKANRSGHWIDFAGKTHLPEQSDAVLVDGMVKEK